MTSSTLPEFDLHAYVDGRLSDERRREVEQFLATHPEDLELARAYQEQNKSLHALFDPVLAEPLPPRWCTPRRRWNSLLISAAVAALWIIIGAWLGWSLRGNYNGRSAASTPFAKQAAKCRDPSVALEHRHARVHLLGARYVQAGALDLLQPLGR